MRLLKWLLLCLPILIPLAVYAQSAEDWRVVVYEWERGEKLDQGGALDMISASGVVERHVLPASILPDNQYHVPFIAVSPDRHYAAVAYGTLDAIPSAPPISIVDLTQDRCCIVMTPPVANPQDYSLIGFNADSSQFAYSYAAFPDLNNRRIEGGLVVADAATGILTATLDLRQIRAATGLKDVSFVQGGQWDGNDRIRFVPGCWACAGALESVWYSWNLSSGAVSKVEHAYFSIFADTLPLTGELLYTVDNTAYPSASQPGYIPPANVVEYYADGVPDGSDSGRQTTAPNATIVYHHADNLNLPRAIWVADGRAFVLQGNEDNPTGTLVFRDQTQIGAGMGESDHFIAATPDGWLVQDAAHSINHYVVGDSTFTIEPIGQMASRVTPVWSTPIGREGLPPFAGITAPSG